MSAFKRFLSLMAFGMNQAERQNAMGGDIYIPMM